MKKLITRDFLKTLITKAHPLRPVVMIGNNGLTEPVHKEVEAALLAHELIKIKVNASSREDREAMIEEMARNHQATIVQKVGHVLVLYRAKK